MERLRRREELRPLHCFAASAILGLPTAVLRLHELLLAVRAARPCVSRAFGNQSNPAHCRSWACSSGRQACRCTHECMMHTCRVHPPVPVCLISSPLQRRRPLAWFCGTSVKQCDAHMPPTRSSEPSCEALKQPPGHLETHPRT